MVEPRFGEVWWVRLDPTIGSEIAKTRPCLIMSRDLINRFRHTVVVVPLSSSPKASPPLLVAVHCDGRNVVAVTDQTRAVSKQRLERRIGELAADELDDVRDALREVLEL